MPDSPELNALYQEWLEIPAHRLPPNHYALLGLEDFETDEATIASAAKARSAYLHQIASGPQRKIVQKFLGQVAIAKRTLLDAESRAAYDATIKSGSSADSAAGSEQTAPEPETESTASERASQEIEDESAARKRKSSATEWKYHAISASVLLLIVGAIYWFNRDGGGRRAAEARPSDPSAISESETRVPQPRASARSVNVARPTPRSTDPGGTKSARRSPIAKRRDTGSGIGSGLGDKFGEVLSDIATRSDSGGNATTNEPGNVESQPEDDGDGGEFRPLASYKLGKVQKRAKKEDLPTGLQRVDQFPNSLIERFESSTDVNWFKIDEAKLVVQPVDTTSVITLSDRETKLHPGSAISINTSLSRKMNNKAQAGFVVGDVRLGIRPINNGIEVFARDVASDSRIESISRIKSNAKQSRLWIARSNDQPDTIDWFVQSGATIRSGQLMVTALDKAPSPIIFISRPTSSPRQPFWLSDLTLRVAEAR